MNQQENLNTLEISPSKSANLKKFADYIRSGTKNWTQQIKFCTDEIRFSLSGVEPAEMMVALEDFPKGWTASYDDPDQPWLMTIRKRE